MFYCSANLQALRVFPDQTFKLYAIRTGSVLDILTAGWSVKFGKKVNLWVNAPDKDPAQFKIVVQILFSHLCGKIFELWNYDLPKL